MVDAVSKHEAGGDSSDGQMILAEDVKKWFGRFQALKGVSMTVNRKETVVIVGPSGSGKSTFIRTINRLERHDAGRIVVDGIELTDDIRNISQVRSEIGMVFQSFNLFPHLTILQNVTLAPRNVRRWSRRTSEEKAIQLLERVGIPEQAGKYPAQLSGGQQQRVAIARALASRPTVLFADEPTGNLDSTSGTEVLALLREAVELDRQTTVMVTHDPRAAATADRVLFLADGRIVDDLADPTEEQILAAMKAAALR
jgi:general L-amino acid transport system ATP-binding protein